MKKWLIPVIVIFAIAITLHLRTHEKIKGVLGVDLIGGCEIEIYDETTQPFTTLVLACPRTDAIRFWPMPIIQPWFEDWNEHHGLEI